MELGPHLVPPCHQKCTITFDENISYVLIVEKEAVFKALCSSTKNEKRLIVTGKGFPDLLSRRFINMITESRTGIPIYCLTDSDIFGCLIYWSYRFGMRQNQEDNSTNFGENTEVTYLGVHLADYPDNYLDITLRDYSMMKSFLSRLDNMKREKLDFSLQSLRKETQRGIFLLKKAEMNCLEDTTDSSAIVNDMEAYIERNIRRYKRKL